MEIACLCTLEQATKRNSLEITDGCLIFPSLLKEIVGTTPFFVAHEFVKKNTFKKCYTSLNIYLDDSSATTTTKHLSSLLDAVISKCAFFSRIKYSPAFLTDNKDVKLISAFHASSPGWTMDVSGSSGGKRFSHKLFLLKPSTG